ncbi:MAG: hypothetical protein PHZ19_06585 [Candidatus Thermoplasmatota archaeon]|nr:hypothetical protein [Candidatus Thermoplasmatota archaeon]
MDPWAWYRRGKERAIDALEAGEITYREYRELRQEALETFQAMVEAQEDEPADLAKKERTK